MRGPNPGQSSDISPPCCEKTCSSLSFVRALNLFYQCKAGKEPFLLSPNFQASDSLLPGILHPLLVQGQLLTVVPSTQCEVQVLPKDPSILCLSLLEDVQFAHLFLQLLQLAIRCFNHSVSPTGKVAYVPASESCSRHWGLGRRARSPRSNWPCKFVPAVSPRVSHQPWQCHTPPLGMGPSLLVPPCHLCLLYSLVVGTPIIGWRVKGENTEMQSENTAGQKKKVCPGNHRDAGYQFCKSGSWCCCCFRQW